MFSISASISSGYASVNSSLTVSRVADASHAVAGAWFRPNDRFQSAHITSVNRAYRKDCCPSFAAQRAEFACSLWSGERASRRRVLRRRRRRKSALESLRISRFVRKSQLLLLPRFKCDGRWLGSAPAKSDGVVHIKS